MIQRGKLSTLPKKRFKIQHLSLPLPLEFILLWPGNNKIKSFFDWLLAPARTENVNKNDKLQTFQLKLHSKIPDFENRLSNCVNKRCIFRY